MRAITASIITIAITVPAGWHALGADIETDGKHVRPLQSETTFDDVRVTLDADRSIVLAGGTVNAKLVAYSDVPKQVTVDLTVAEQDDFAGSRVATPPKLIDHEKITLHAAPGGGKPVSTAIKLEPPATPSSHVESYKIFVEQHGAKPEDEGGSKPAAVGVIAWHGNTFDMAIERTAAHDDAPFTVAVRMTNTSGENRRYRPSISLGTALGFDGEIAESDDFTIEPIGDDGTHRFKSGATFVQKFLVTPQRKGIKRVTFIASAYVWGEDISPIEGGAIDMRTFSVTESHPAVAEK